MTDLRLHFAPDTCGRVALIALEEIGQPYEIDVVAFMRGDNRSTASLEINPGGKVPTLIVDGRPLTENVAILSYLTERFPEGRLLPPADAFGRVLQLADLAFCASGLHPLVTRIRIPQYFCDQPEGCRRVFEMAEAAMTINLGIVERRLANDSWWYGKHWSIVEAYISWVWFRVTGTAFDASGFPNLACHDRKIRERPSVRRALCRNDDVADLLAA